MKRKLLFVIVAFIVAFISCEENEPLPVAVTDVTLNAASLELTEGEDAVLIATVSPENAANRNVTWSSSDATVATVNAGKVTAVKAGFATITVTTEDGGKTAVCEVTVSAKVYPVESVTLDKTTLELTEGEEATLTAKVSPENATNKNVTWTSSDEEVANVDGGKVTAVKVGTATITVTTEDGGKTATCDVTVNSKVYPVESVTLDKTTLELTEGEEATLTATVSPENATNKNVTWTSSDEEVATVTDGKVTAVNAGTTTITVTTEDGGKTATCVVTIIHDPQNDPIVFADAEMKAICVNAFDFNSDGELSYKEACMVDDLSKMELISNTFKSFDEFQYFLSVKTIPDNFFANSTSLQSIVLPEGLESIGVGAFSDCSALRNITISNTVTNIGNYAFGGCSGLSTIVLPDSVHVLGDTVFSTCTNLKEVVMSSNITHIEQYTFSFCFNLNKIILPEKLEMIKANAFYYCSSLENITLPENLKVIGEDDDTNPQGVFLGCTKLKSIIIPKNVLYIGNSSFQGCTSLSEVIILGSITSIKRSMFSGCKNLTRIVLPESLKEIEHGAFANCENLSQVDIASVESWCQVSFLTPDNYGFYPPDSSHPMKYGADLYVKGEKVTDLVIPEGVTTIADNAFKNCTSIKTLTIPESLTYIGAGAFAECNYLREVYCKPTTPPILEDYTSLTYYSSIDYRLTNFYVPYVSLELYKTAEIWSGYYNKGTEFFPNPNFFGYDFETGEVVE